MVVDIHKLMWLIQKKHIEKRNDTSYRFRTKEDKPYDDKTTTILPIDPGAERNPERDSGKKGKTVNQRQKKT